MWSQQKAGRARGPSKAKAAAKEGEEEQEKKAKPVPAQYIRGPPLPKPAAQQVSSSQNTAPLLPLSFHKTREKWE